MDVQIHYSVVTEQSSKENLKNWWKKHKIKVVHGRPYHPESQGKVERNNALIKRKLKYLISTKQGANWVKELPKVCYALNSAPKEAIGYLTPISVYFWLSEKSADRMREKAKYASLKSTNRSSFKKDRVCSIYKVGEKVLLKYPFSKSRVPRKLIILEGKNVKRYESLMKYYVKFVVPDIKKKNIDLVQVEHITSLTREKEESRPKLSPNNFEKQLRQEAHRNKYYITIDDKEPTQLSENQNDSGQMSIADSEEDEEGFPDYINTVYNPMKYGNCQFGSVSHQLMSIARGTNFEK